ncbi:hypothetical protein ACFWM1_03060 [Nocardia sp. NPDC058379]|uniref:hypothetical protein n=1 Tax=unclassified Nocardia TaxID=2637762 RepID=UPI003654EE76
MTDFGRSADSLIDIIEQRATMITYLGQGDYGAALSVGHMILSSIPAFDAAEPGNLPLLTQVNAVLSDTVLAAIGAGAEAHARVLLEQLVVSAGETRKAGESALVSGITRCAHGHMTLSANGGCMSRPPCP